MVNLKSIVVGSVLVLSISSLTGCSQILEKVTEKNVAPSSEETVDINGQKVKLPDNSLVMGEDSNERPQVSLEEGFKVVGDDEYGWLQIPEDFVKFIEATNPNSPAKQFAKGDKSFILTFNPLPTEASHEDLVMNLVEHMRSQGPSVLAIPTEVNGNKATELFQHFEKDNYIWHVWIIEEGNSRKYISMEYTGDQEELKNKILNSYSATEPVTKDSSVSSDTTNSNTPISTSSDFNLVPQSDNFKEVHISKENLRIHVFGDFNENSTYFASIYDQVDFDSFSYQEVKPTKAKDGSLYLDLDFKLEREPRSAVHNVDITDTGEDGFFEKVEFTIE